MSRYVAWVWYCGASPVRITSGLREFRKTFRITAGVKQGLKAKLVITLISSYDI